MIVYKPKAEKITIDLDGPKGNAFVLLNLARRLAVKLEVENWDRIEKLMMSNRYAFLVQVFNYYFGEFVILHASSKSLIEELNSVSGDEVAVEMVKLKLALYD